MARSMDYPKPSSASTNKRNNALITRSLWRAAAWVTIIFLVSLTIFPILYMIFESLKTNNELVSNTYFLPSNSLWPGDWQWHNYIDMWGAVNFGYYFRNSIIVCGITTIIATTVSIFSSYALARFRFPGSDTFGLAVLATQLIPGVMFLLPLYNVFLWLKNHTPINLINNYQGLILIYIAFFIPLSLWIMRGFFASIPVDLEEQGMVDGCTRMQAFFRITLPLAVPGIMSTAIYIFLTAWDELLFAYTLTSDPSVQTIPVGIRTYIGNISNSYNLAMAAGVVITIPVLLIFFVMQRQMISGLTAGAVK